jgi:hypothetical protein
MKIMKVTFKGIAPLLMNSNVCVNPLHPITLERKQITGKRKKTEDDYLDLIILDLKGAMYYDEKLGPYIPAICVEATLREAAKKIKKGTSVKSSLFVEPDFIKLEYEGPREFEKLIKDERFRDVRPVTVQRSQVIKARPRFNSWAINFTITYDELILDQEAMGQIFDIAGRQIGICDYRPRYGRFEVYIT